MKKRTEFRTIQAAIAFALWSSAFPGALGLSPQAGAIIIYGQAYSAAAVPELITPVALYTSGHIKSLAALYRANQEHVAGLNERFPGGTFRLLDTVDSSVGGVGFWMNPAQFGNPDRYLGLFARVVLPTETPFRNDQPGRVAAIMDRYGKPSLEVLSKELESISDPAVKGGALIFIFSKEPLSSPTFDSNAEALVLYMPKADISMFAQYRMTLQALFNKSDMFMFQGTDQIQTLTHLFIQV
jgi:hypothetical protein